MRKEVALLMALTMSPTALAGCSGGDAPKKGGEYSIFGKSRQKEKKDRLEKLFRTFAMYNEGEPEAAAIQKEWKLFMEDYPECEEEIQWVGRSNQDVVGTVLEGGGTDRYS